MSGTKIETYLCVTPGPLVLPQEGHLPPLGNVCYVY